MRTHLDEPFRIEELAGSAGMSATRFHRHLKAVTAMGPHAYGKQVRLHETPATAPCRAEPVDPRTKRSGC